MAKFVLNQRGNRKLVYDGYGYVKRREMGGAITWICDQRKRMRKDDPTTTPSVRCCAYARTLTDPEDGAELALYGEHTHPPIPGLYEIMLAKNLLREKATSDLRSPSTTIVSEVVGQVPDEARPNFLKNDSIRRQIQRYRSAKRPRDPDWDQLSVTEKRRRGALAAAATRRAQQAIQESGGQQQDNEATTAAAWLQSDGQGTPNRYQARIIPGTYPATNTDDAAFDDADDYDSADLPDTTAMPSTAPGRTFTSTGIRTRGGITKGTRGAASSIGHRGPAQGMINASVQDIVRILETTRKKSRWESFADYIAKTLEALPAHVARQTAGDIQDLLLRVQEGM